MNRSHALSKLMQRAGLVSVTIFPGLLSIGLLFSGDSLFKDLSMAHVQPSTWLPHLLRGVAPVIAQGFEVVNGFHDTANAAATLISPHSLPPHVAVMWSGAFNSLGVPLSSGAVAFGIIALRPVELLLQVGSSAGYAMVLALLIAAILWTLGTWWLGLPASSSHMLIGSIIGVGVANALMHGSDGTSWADWSQMAKIGQQIGKSQLTYAQGASAELVAMATIGAADVIGLPVSAPHVRPSAVAGTMAVNRFGRQIATVRSMTVAWGLVLPATLLLSASLYRLFTHLF